MAVSFEDRGIVLATRAFGEHDIIATVFGAERGRFTGLVKGGSGRKFRGLLQPGNVLKTWWRARLDEQLGVLTVEPLNLMAGRMLDSAIALAGISAVCALLDVSLPDREPHAALYDSTVDVLTALESDAAGARYAMWELGLLRELGFGLDLSACAVTGATDGLEFVSPKSGRAVSRAGAGDYVDRLLRLPSFLTGDSVPSSIDDVRAALKLTGHFLDAHVFAGHGRTQPPARARFVDLLKS